MAFFVQLLANYAGLIYIALIVGVVFYLREIIAARQDLQQSLYSLEREAANSRLWRSVVMLVLVGLDRRGHLCVVDGGGAAAGDRRRACHADAGVYAAHEHAHSDVPADADAHTASAHAGAGYTHADDRRCADRRRLRRRRRHCRRARVLIPNVQIVAPIAGQAFSGEIQVRGTADAPNFAFYKFTLNGPATNNVTQTAGDVVRAPVRDGVLGAIDPTNLVSHPGVYVVGLVVVDNTGNELPHCTVSIVIQP